MMIQFRQNLFLSKILESSHRLRFKTNQIMMELSFMLKFHLLTLVSPHLMSMKLTRIKSFQAKLHGKIEMTCLIRYGVKQTGWYLQLLYVDPISRIQCCNGYVNGWRSQSIQTKIEAWVYIHAEWILLSFFYCQIGFILSTQCALTRCCTRCLRHVSRTSYLEVMCFI